MSSGATWDRRSRNSTVLWRRSSSDRAWISGSRALMSGTNDCKAFSFLPSPARRTFVRIDMDPECTGVVWLSLWRGLWRGRRGPQWGVAAPTPTAAPAREFEPDWGDFSRAVRWAKARDPVRWALGAMI